MIHWHLTLGGDKVSMLTHTYTHKHLTKFKWLSAVTSLLSAGWQPTVRAVFGLMSDLVICKHRNEYGHTWHWMSLLRPGVIKQHRTKRNHWQKYNNDINIITDPFNNIKTSLALIVLNFWKFTSYCSLKPLWSGMGEVVPARTSPTLHPPSPPTMHQLSRLAL